MARNFINRAIARNRAKADENFDHTVAGHIGAMNGKREVLHLPNQPVLVKGLTPEEIIEFRTWLAEKKPAPKE